MVVIRPAVLILRVRFRQWFETLSLDISTLSTRLGSDSSSGSSDIQPETEPSIAQRESYPCPIVHGVGLSFNFGDTDIYDHVRDLWYDKIGSKESESEQGAYVCSYDPDFLDSGAEYGVFLTSSGWLAGEMDSNDSYTQYYEYKLKLRKKNADSEWIKPATSLSITLAPQTHDLVYSDGNDYPLPFGEGTLCQIQTTYPESGHGAILRSIDMLSEVIEYNPGSWISDSARITKLETHLRFDIGRKSAAVECLQRSENLIAWGGGAEIDTWRQRQAEGWLEARTRSDRWDLLGFDSVDYETQIKIYQTNDWHERDREDSLHHPKIESEYQQGSRDSHPKLEEWDSIVAQLRDKVVQHAQWAGIEPSDLISDSYFGGGEAQEIGTPGLEGRREDLQARYNELELPILNEVSKSSSKGPYDIIHAVQRHNGCTYDTLEEETGLSRSNIRYHVKRFVELGFVERVGNPTIVVFAAPHVSGLIEEAIEKTGPDTVARERIEREDRRTERQASREENSDSGQSEATDSDSDSSSERALFRYICDMGITAEQLSALLAANVLAEKDIRVREKPGLEAQASAVVS